MKRNLFFISVLMSVFCGFTQVKYAPIDKKDLERAGRLLMQERFSSLLSDNYLSIGFMDFGPVERFASYNPVEGVRLRLSGRTNSKLSKRIGFNWLLAYGTEDKKLKYGLSVGISFKRKPTSVYAFPANALTLSYEDNSYMPNTANYDVLYYSFAPWRNYYLSYNRKISMTYLYEHRSGLGFSRTVGFRSLYSNIYHDGETSFETLDKDCEYLNAGVEIFFRPTRKHKSKRSLNSRLNNLPTNLSANYTHNFLLNDFKKSYSTISFTIAERIFIGKRFATDIMVKGGKIMGSTNQGLYFTPMQSFGIISDAYGFNLLAFDKRFYRKEYLQCFLQINTGGFFSDMLPFLKQYRMNEFVYGKALYGEYKPYYELGLGVDNILSCLGVEVIRSFSMEEDSHGGFWGCRLRLRY